MPVIHSDAGVVIAWSGIQAGPIQEYEPIGAESPWVRYEAEVGIGNPDTAKVIVRVPKTWRGQVPGIWSVDVAERQAVSEFIEGYLKADKKPLETGTTNYFNMSDEQMLESCRK
jgi:hypothetical protein